MRAKKGLFFFLQLSVSAAFLWFAFRNVDTTRLWNILRTSDPMWVLIGIAFYVASLCIRIKRWRLMLAKFSPAASFTMCVGPFLGSMTMNNFLPFRAGDLVRLFAFNRPLRISGDASIASLVVERVLDVLVFTLTLGGMSTVFELYESSPTLAGMLPFCILACIPLAAIVFFPALLVSITTWLLGIANLSFPGIVNKLLIFGLKSLNDISHIMKGGIALRLFAYTVTMWIADALFYFATASSIPAITYPPAAFLMVSVCALSLVVPSAPGGLGTFNYFGILSMTALRNDYDSASAVVLTIHFCVLFVPLFLFLLWSVVSKILEKMNQRNFGA